MHRRGRGQPHLTSKEKERIATIAFRMEQNMSNEGKVKMERGTVTLSPQVLHSIQAQGIGPLQAFCRMSVTETFLENRDG